MLWTWNVCDGRTAKLIIPITLVRKCPMRSKILMIHLKKMMANSSIGNYRYVSWRNDTRRESMESNAFHSHGEWKNECVTCLLSTKLLFSSIVLIVINVIIMMFDPFVLDGQIAFGYCLGILSFVFWCLLILNVFRPAGVRPHIHLHGQWNSHVWGSKIEAKANQFSTFRNYFIEIPKARQEPCFQFVLYSFADENSECCTRPVPEYRCGPSWRCKDRPLCKTRMLDW